MAGREPIKVHTYTLGGKYLHTYESVQKYRKANYPQDIFKRPCFVKRVRNVVYEIVGDQISFQERPGKDTIRFIVAVDKSEYCKLIDTSNDKAIEVYNHLGEKLAEFVNQRILHKMMPHIRQSLVSTQLRSIRRTNLKKNGLYFKYKE